MNRQLVTALLLCATAAGCGGFAASHHATVASRVCSRASHSAAGLLGAPLTARVSDSNPADIKCVVSGAGISVDVVAQALKQAWEIYDAYSVQETQAYAWGTAQMQKELPIALPLRSFSADWIPAVDEMIATNGS